MEAKTPRSRLSRWIRDRPGVKKSPVHLTKRGGELWETTLGSRFPSLTPGHAGGERHCSAASQRQFGPSVLEIVRLIGNDMSSREIESKLFISERTVETHVTNMLNKLGLNSRIQIARWLARKAG